jgi:hypothetical protein
MEKQKFRNMTGGFIGVMVENDHGKMSGISLAPGEGWELSEREQRATANAPRDPKDNPFIGGFKDPDTGETGPALLPIDASEEVQRPIGTAPAPEDDAPEGTRPSDEEVATPEAPKAKAAASKKRPAVTA